MRADGVVGNNWWLRNVTNRPVCALSEEAELFIDGAATPPCKGGDSRSASRASSFSAVFGVRAILSGLLAVFILLPGAAVAQQAAQGQTEKTPVKTDDVKKDEATQAKPEEDSKLTNVQGGKALGMSILGNQEAPKALVIVPWKSSELGTGPSVSTQLDDSKLPVDKEVFMRMLSYYQVRTETKGTVEAPANAGQRRKP
jgi:hypothetical protein